MSVKFISAVWSAREIGEQSTLLVLLALADWSNDDGWSWPSIPTLAEKARISDRHVRRILKALEDSKIVQVEHRSGRNHTNRYKLNLPICPVLFKIEDAENLTSETEKRTPVSVDADIACPINRQEPLVEPSKSGAVTDPRFSGVKNHVKRCCEHAKVPFVWDGGEGMQLSKWLKAAPDVPLDRCIEFVKQRFRLAREPGERPKKWIGDLGKFTGANGNHGNQINKSQARQSGNVEAITEAIRRRAAREAGEDSSGDGHGIESYADAGRGRLAAGQVGEISERARNIGIIQSPGRVADKGEILTPHKRPTENHDG